SYAPAVSPVPAAMSSLLVSLLGVAGTAWLYARIGFLLPHVVATSEGPVLRRAHHISTQHLWRNCGLLILLLLPRVARQIVGGFALRAATGKPFAGSNLPLADSARLMADTLGGFAALASLSVSVSIVLLTAGAIAVYRAQPAARVIPIRTRFTPLNLARTVL